MRTIKAIFEIEGDSNLAGVSFQCGKRRIEWDKLTREEQVHMLNAWCNHHELFSRFLKKEEI